MHWRFQRTRAPEPGTHRGDFSRWSPGIQRMCRLTFASGLVAAMTACLDPVDVDRPLDKAFVINGVDPVEDLGTIGGPSSFAFGINASGTIVGESTIDTLSSTRHAFRIPPRGSMQRLIPTDTESVAFDVNDNGQITGHIMIANRTEARGFVWTPGASPELQILPTLAGNQAQAFAINNSGVAVGVSQPAVGEFHAVLWNASGAIQDLGTLGSTTKFAEAHDINSTGVVVGLTRNASNELRAFRWTSSTGMVELSTPWGGFTSANAINSAGQIVGEATSASGPVHAVLWDTSGAVIDLDSLSTSGSAARAITDDGIIVGTRFLPGGSRVFAWDPDTRTLTDVGPGDGNDVNASGRIVGTLFPHAAAWQLQLQQALTIELIADSARLPGDTSLVRGISPEIRRVTLDTATFARIPGTSTLFSVHVVNGTQKLSGYSLQVRAELLPDSNGLVYLPDSIPFEDDVILPNNQFEPNPGMPVAGHFVFGGVNQPVINVASADTVTTARLVAGYYGAEVRLIAQATVGGTTLKDTVQVPIRIANLVPDTLIRYAFFTGWDTAGANPFRYPIGFTWHMKPIFRDSLATLAKELADTAGATKYYLQFNDASLKRGGMFRVEATPVRQPWATGLGHFSHTHGIDIDIGWCYAKARGVNETQQGRVRPIQSGTGYICPTNERAVDSSELDRLARRIGAQLLREGNHYHLRRR